MDDVFLPPYVVNDYNPIMSQSQTVDWGISKLSIETIHSSGITGKGIKVAVIDTYINPNHPDIIGGVVKAINVTSETPTNQNGHGQGVASVIGARNNNTGTLGVAPNCDIVAIKAMRETGSGQIAEIIKGIDAAIAEKVHIINMSLGTSADIPEMKAAIKRASDAGIFLVCAAGNDGQADSVNYPGKYDSTFAIAATNQDGKVSSFSSMGWDVDLAAPGEQILTAWKNNGYSTVSGTSFSSPFVAGVLALLLEAGVEVTIDKLDQTSVDIEAPGKDVKAGWGLINPTGYLTKYSSQKPSEDLIEALKCIDNLKALVEHFLNK